MLEIRKRDRAGRVLALPNQTPGLLAQVGLTRAAVDYEIWVITVDGRQYSGTQAANVILKELGGLGAFFSRFYSIPPLGWIENRLYRWIADHRSQISNWWGAVPECEQPGIECE